MARTVSNVHERYIARGERVYTFPEGGISIAHVETQMSWGQLPSMSRDEVDYVEDRWGDRWYYHYSSGYWRRLNAASRAQHLNSYHSEVQLLLYYGPLRELIVNPIVEAGENTWAPTSTFTAVDR